jgi:hypothetical protein
MPGGPGRPYGADGVETRRKMLHSARQIFSTIGFDRASRCRVVLPEDAGLGATPHSRARAGAERTRWGLSPATMSMAVRLNDALPA